MISWLRRLRISLPHPSWRHIAVFVCIFTPLGFVAWLIWGLMRPSYWCGVIVGAGRAAGVRSFVQDCTPVLLALIDKLGTLGLVLVMCAAIGLITWIVIGLGGELSFRGPAGMGGEVKASPPPPPPAAVVTTTTAVTTPGNQIPATGLSGKNAGG